MPTRTSPDLQKGEWFLGTSVILLLHHDTITFLRLRLGILQEGQFVEGQVQSTASLTSHTGSGQLATQAPGYWCSNQIVLWIEVRAWAWHSTA